MVANGASDDEGSETHRIWECVAVVKFLAAQNAFQKRGRLLFERLTALDVEREQREAIAGEAMLRAADSGLSMEKSMVVRNAVLKLLNDKAKNDPP